MRRRFLAAVAMAPLLAVGAGETRAATEISSSTTTPVATATANAGAPDDVDIASGGSINPTAAGAALTLNSNNTVSSEGSISFSNVDNAIGIQVDGGNTGLVNNTGAITINETYTAPTSTTTGIAYGDWASGGNRIGILVTGNQPFNGGITTTGAINIQGNNSDGIVVDDTITGSLLSLTVTPASGSTAASVANGSITVTGNNVAGLYVTPNGGVGGNVRITSITASGIGAQGAVIDGNVGGTVNISSSVTASGYRSNTRPSTPFYSTQYTPDQLEQGGSAVSIGANIGQGLIISAPPSPLSTTNLDQDGDGVPDALQGTGSLTAFGSAPALQIGSTTRTVELGVVGTGANDYGLVIQGSVSANGVYDPLLTPSLPAVVPATALQIGGPGDAATILDNGLHNTGSIVATAYQADATAIHIGSGATVASVINDGSIIASSTQVNSATAPTPVTIGNGPSTVTIPTPAPVSVTALQIDTDATVHAISNSKTISATLSGSGGVGGAVAAIIDQSGSVTTIDNTGNITAALNQTYVPTQMPGTTKSIDIHLGAGPQTITQGFAPGVHGAADYVSTNSYAIGAIAVENGEAYQAIAAVATGQDPAGNPTLWVAIGTTTPSIVGSIYFGNGGSTLTVTGGSVAADTIGLGSGVNTITVNGDAPSTVNGVTTGGTVVAGAITDEGASTLTLNVQSGTLNDTFSGTYNARSINVGANGTLLVAANPAAGTHTEFFTTGPSVFADGAQLGITLQSVQTAPSVTYTILQTTGQGTLSVGTFGTSYLNNAPYLYTATPSYLAADPATGAGEVQLTVTRRTAAQLNFNGAEGAALNAVLSAIPSDNNIQQAVLDQTTEAGLKSVYDQLLPDQGQGIFESLDAAAQSIANLTGTTPDAGTRVAGTSLWVQEVNERVQRSGVNTLGSYSQLLGLVAGYEHAGPAGGALGLTVAYLNAQETDDGTAVGAHVVGSMVEGGVYYRRAAGPLTASIRGAAGYAWFGDDRKFLTANALNQATSNWGGVYFTGHTGASYEMDFGRFYARPQVSVDYLRLQEGAHSDVGGGPGFDLSVASRTSTRLSGDAVMVLGTQWGKANWLRAELRGGYREILAGTIGDTTASFANGQPFTLPTDPDTGGWITVGFALKSGSPYSYVALEGEADLRQGQQRYDLMVAGRSLF